jgi:hypothetical protein
VRLGATLPECWALRVPPAAETVGRSEWTRTAGSDHQQACADPVVVPPESAVDQRPGDSLWLLLAPVTRPCTVRHHRRTDWTYGATGPVLDTSGRQRTASIPGCAGAATDADTVLRVCLREWMLKWMYGKRSPSPFRPGSPRFLACASQMWWRRLGSNQRREAAMKILPGVYAAGWST